MDTYVLLAILSVNIKEPLKIDLSSPKSLKYLAELHYRFPVHLRTLRKFQRTGRNLLLCQHH